MKSVFTLLFCLCVGEAFSQSASKDSSTKAILLQQLKETQEEPQWFVPLGNAIKDLTPAQAMWKPDDSSHSIVQLVSHLLYWNSRSLNSFLGKTNGPFNGNNDETFANLQPGQWEAIVGRVDSLSKAWENAVASAKPSVLTKANYEMIARTGTHNAYHTGQIMYIRKQEHAWDAGKGVK